MVEKYDRGWILEKFEEARPNPNYNILVRNCYNNTRKNYPINKPQVLAQRFQLRVNRLLKLEKIEVEKIEKIEHLDEGRFRLMKKSTVTVMKKKVKKMSGNEVLEVHEANVQIFH